MSRFLIAAATAVVLFAGCIGLGYVWLVKLNFTGTSDEVGLGLIMLVWILGGIYVFARATKIPLHATIHRSPRLSAVERKRREEAQRVYRERKERCIARLQADPKLHRLIPLAEKGRIFSEEQITYYTNPEMCVTCPHMRPIEAAMRAAGIETHWVNPAGQSCAIQADCRVEEKALVGRYGLPPDVIYVEHDNPHDGPEAYLWCKLCYCPIWTKHPWEARASTPRFPESS